VLLSGYLVPQLHETGFRPRLDRKGNKTVSISTRAGIAFRDVAKLLAPGTNLRKFGQLFGLEQAKAHFPFAALTGVSCLSLPGLPEDPALWRSELSGEDEATALRNREDAKALFESSGCRTLGEYLAVYLKLDVEILYKATQLWRAHLREVVGLDFVECRKFTISSLAYTAGLKKSEGKLRVAPFFPNSGQAYRLLRNGMRGGLCSVFRSSAGSGAGAGTGRDPAQHRNNGHLLPSSEPSRCVAYYDAASLYPSSGEYSIQSSPNAPGAHPGRPGSLGIPAAPRT